MKRKVNMEPKPTKHRWSWLNRKLHIVLRPGVTCEIERDISHLDQFASANDSKTELESDLVDIATAIYGSDRLASRPNGFLAHELNWRRHLIIQIPVRDPDFWSQPSASRLLQDVLAELSDDIWELSFYAQTDPRTVGRRGALPARPPRIAWFSGGLDSLAGTLALLKADRSPAALVSFDTNSHNKSFQSKVGALLQRKLASDVAITPYRMHFNHTGLELREQDRRQRARSFLYFVITSVLARRLHQSQVHVLENGITSLNLPISTLLSSSRVTRTTHPLVLLAFERLIRHVFEWPEFELLLPHLLQTKAEMVAPFAHDYRDMIAETISCARYMNAKICGTCTACLLRRQVFWLNGLEDLDLQEQARAKRDILRDFSEKSDDDRTWYFLASLENAARLRADPNIVTLVPSLLRTAVDWRKQGCTSGELLARMVSLHKRYSEEWQRFLSRAAEYYPELKRLGA